LPLGNVTNNNCSPATNRAVARPRPIRAERKEKLIIFMVATHGEDFLSAGKTSIIRKG
jgi:hypothetical protein